jgi:hypothetical protein
LILAVRAWVGFGPSGLIGGREELAELVADLAALRVAVFPLVGINLEGGVGLAMSEAALDVDEVVVEGDQHAGVAVPQVVQGQAWCRKVGGFEGAAERPADNSAFEARLVARWRRPGRVG